MSLESLLQFVIRMDVLATHDTRLLRVVEVESEYIFSLVAHDNFNSFNIFGTEVLTWSIHIFVIIMQRTIQDEDENLLRGNDDDAFLQSQGMSKKKRRHFTIQARKALFHSECKEKTWKWAEPARERHARNLISITHSTACGLSNWRKWDKQGIPRQGVFAKVVCPCLHPCRRRFYASSLNWGSKEWGFLSQWWCWRLPIFPENSENVADCPV